MTTGALRGKGIDSPSVSGTKQQLLNGSLNVPCSKESELMVLSCMMGRESAVDVACDVLKASDFFYIEHQKIFEAMDAVRKEDAACDVTILSEMLKRKGTLKDVGGVGKLVEIAAYSGTSANLDDYINVVKSKSMLRTFHRACSEYAERSYANPEDPYQLLEEAQKKICSIGHKHDNTIKSLKDLLMGPPSFMKQVEEWQYNKGSLRGITTGIQGLDELLSGLQAGHLITVGARPAMGKTTFALNLASTVAQRKAVLFFSLEMTEKQLVERIACAAAAINMERMVAGELTSDEVERLRARVEELAKMPLYIDDTPQIKIAELKGRARRLKEKHGIGLICVDYLTLIQVSSTKEQNREQHIGEITRELKGLARELQIPIVVLSQLSRKVEERTIHRPMLSDLRESGSVEQESDSVILLYRPDYYDMLGEQATYAIVAKNRHGRVGDVKMKFYKEFQRFLHWTE